MINYIFLLEKISIGYIFSILIYLILLMKTNASFKLYSLFNLAFIYNYDICKHINRYIFFNKLLFKWFWSRFKFF
ncbi:hypothetical protein MOMA_02150 [Moraxella macacae 0408225]|uniref:Uncharacterized protein n=1 Tax=Moraxella macacae 0408225 TaxID=1230338 RepID=L2F8U5_9GAMM|nr:hypothetical protein MOMA_02150 [Moraxella macacae 0408225]